MKALKLGMIQQKKAVVLIGLLTVGFLTTSLGNSPVGPIIEDEFVVVLDAGHGGHDPGNLGNGYLEKNIALNIVKKIGAVLERDKGIRVIYTREDDSFVDLYVRGEIANKANADLFVSVHCDSHTSNAHGAGTFVLGLHANKQNFEIAKKENQVIYLEDNYETRYAEYDINSPESVIGLTIMQEEFLDQSIALAKGIQDKFTNKLKRKDREVKQAGFIVLHQTFMPSVLVETGFLTNDDEGAYLNSSEGQAQMGTAIAEAIINYKRGVQPKEKLSSAILSTPTPTPDTTPIQETSPTPEPVVSQKKSGYDPYAEAKETEKNQTSSNSKVEEAINRDKLPLVKEVINEKLDDEVIEDVSKPAQEEIKEVISEPEVVKVVEEASEPAEVIPEKIPEMEKTRVMKEEVAVIEKAPDVVKESTSEIVFKVQLMASTKKLALVENNFKGLGDLSTEKFKAYNRYMYGKTNSIYQARVYKEQAVAKGYTSAYIVAYQNGVRIPTDKAIKLSSQ